MVPAADEGAATGVGLVSRRHRRPRIRAASIEVDDLVWWRLTAPRGASVDAVQYVDGAPETRVPAIVVSTDAVNSSGDRAFSVRILLKGGSGTFLAKRDEVTAMSPEDEAAARAIAATELLEDQ